MTNKNIVLIFIIFIVALVCDFSVGDHIKFKATQTSTIPMNFELSCDYKLKKGKEFFSSLSIMKDYQVFYHYDNKTISNPKFSKVIGIHSIIEKGPGHLDIHNANHSTSGSYQCVVYFNGGYYMRKLNITVKPTHSHHTPHLTVPFHFQVTPHTFRINTSVSIYCESKLQSGKHLGLIRLALIKDRKIFATIDQNGFRSQARIGGISNLTWINSKIQPPLMHVKINNTTKLTSGNYLCQITFQNLTTGQTYLANSTYQYLYNTCNTISLSMGVILISIAIFLYNQFNN
ncbi:uncharacterized protein LOC128960201 [Oppia nitens]|uniref:uncharacterized protein LOC128960201 n=1 Tax=Oppia nitens TaxID=1686743 RepID=UPI0023DBAEBC|nr:uncharacterized protein LOC128960201 [Oppia nitens]